MRSDEDKESITKYGSFTNPIRGDFYDPDYFCGIDFSFNIIIARQKQPRRKG